MALRHFVRKCSPPLWCFTSLNAKPEGITTITKGNVKNQLLSHTTLSPCIARREPSSDIVTKKFTASYENNKFIDLFTNNAHKRLYVPTITINTLKVYQDINNISKSIEDNRKIIKIIDPSVVGQFQKKEAVRMLIIRRRKMKKHKLVKLRKRMKFIYAKIKFKRQLRKEQIFRSELLTQVEAAEKFDAKEYVEKILHTLRYHPKPESAKERREKYRLKMKENRYQTNFIPPNFDA